MSQPLPKWSQPISPGDQMPIEWRRWFEEVEALKATVAAQAATIAAQAATIADHETRIETLEP